MHYNPRIYVVWLRLCSEEFSSTAPATDSTVAAADSIIATVDNMYRAETGSHGEYVRDAGRVRQLLLPGEDANDLYGSTSFMTEPDLEKYLDKRTISLQQYAALFMLDHASTVERSASISSYSVIQAGMTISFLQLHAYHWSFLGPDKCKHCRFGYNLPNPAHPLHLAVTHGLNLYVSDFLTSNEDRLLPETYTRRRRSALYFKSQYDTQSTDRVDVRSRHQRVELLEFAVFYADDPSMVSSILTTRKQDVDAALVTALSEGKSLDVIQCLLQNKAASGPIILSPPNLEYSDAFQDQPDDDDDDDDDDDSDEGSKNIQINTWNYPHSLATQPNVGPLWIVARCHIYQSFHDLEKIIDLFLSQGEDINGICGPFGTALHAAVSKPDPPNSFLRLMTILLERGADINASGPLGTPLDLFWMTLRSKSLAQRQRYGIEYCDIVKAYIDYKRLDNLPHPESGLPTAEQMIGFCRLEARYSSIISSLE